MASPVRGQADLGLLAKFCASAASLGYARLARQLEKRCTPALRKEAEEAEAEHKAALESRGRLLSLALSRPFRGWPSAG